MCLLLLLTINQVCLTDIVGYDQLKFSSNFTASLPSKKQLAMWANAKRDGRPAEYRWRPLFNAAKFG